MMTNATPNASTINATTAREYARIRAALAPKKSVRPFVGVPSTFVAK